MLHLNVKNETSRLKAVVLGTAQSNGPTPTVDEAYDPKSLEHIKAGTYPVEADMVTEMEALNAVFQKYGVEVYRPQVINDYNQIFSRDIGFVIDDIFIKANILPDRERELDAIQYVIDKMDPAKVVRPPEEVHIEGGDVILWNDHIFIGTYKGSDYKDFITARTNMHGVNYIKQLFPNKIVKEFDLVKSRIEARDNALHLDCCFQPVGRDKGVIYKSGFREEADYLYLVKLFGKENLFHIDREEMYHMTSNFFSIDDNVVVIERNFTRLKNWLLEHGFTVEEVPYAEIAKQAPIRLSNLRTVPVYSASALKQLSQEGAIESRTVPATLELFGGDSVERDVAPSLNQEQHNAVTTVSTAKGFEGDATPFNGIQTRDIAKLLGTPVEQGGCGMTEYISPDNEYEGYGNEVLYNGMTGDQLDFKIFIGPTYYHRLKHMVDDKMHSRSKGPYQMLTRQPSEGRSREGGLRIGEMERDCMIAHGSAQFLKERMLDVSDLYKIYVDKDTGLFSIGTPENGTLKDGITNVKALHIPYAFKLLHQELMSIGIAVRLRTG